MTERLRGSICCDGYWLNKITDTCEVCPVGLFGRNCSRQCPYPTYGKDCQSHCYCEHHLCHYYRGCTEVEANSDIFRSLYNSDQSSDEVETDSDESPFDYDSGSNCISDVEESEGIAPNWTSKMRNEDVTNIVGPNVTEFEDTYGSTPKVKENEYVVKLALALIGIFVLFFGMFATTYIYQKCIHKRANTMNTQENKLDRIVHYTTLNSEIREQVLELNQEQRERLIFVRTNAMVFDGDTFNEEAETGNISAKRNLDTNNENFEQAIEVIQETIEKINKGEEKQDLTSRASPKHIYMEIIDDNMTSYINENALEDFREEKHCTHKEETRYMN
ncbi:uncharacterized protein LOC134256313 [Saccostrea cucullata]|uniref:uncharacterized protein LOC134256313 n=1 Tax=Saccostrea cuccullata TaxID=36930 RepID=UPI002ED5F67B